VSIAEWVSSILSSVAIVVSVMAMLRTAKQEAASAALTERLNARDHAIENRRFVTTQLWDRMAVLRNLDPANPVPEDVRRAANTLEMVALCWESEIVDQEMVLVMFQPFYDRLCDDIAAIKSPLPGLNRSGYELIAQSPVILTVRDEMRAQQRKRNTISKLK